VAKKAVAKKMETVKSEKELKIEEFFADFNAKCLVVKKEKQKIREDFLRAINDLCAMGVPLSIALDRLSADNLGGFYCRSSAMWYSLDNAAKIYPISMKRESQAVFRLSAYMKEEVVPSLLQVALLFTVKRFPGFATTLKKGFFWHYLNSSKTRYAAEEETGIPCRPLIVSKSNSHTFRVIYYKNRISVEFFHVLTDGTGGIEFLKSLISEYLRLLGNEIDSEGLFCSVDSTPTSEEFENAFLKVPNASVSSGFVDKKSLQMSGKLSREKPVRIIHFKVNRDELSAVSKRFDATITGYLLSVIFLALKKSSEELKGELSIQLPVNMRKYVPSKTLRNFAMYCGIRLAMEEIGSREEIIPKVKEQMNKKASFEEMQKMTTATKKLVGSLNLIPLFIKQPIARLVYSFLGDRLFSTTFSNLGVITMPEKMSEKIESMDFILGPSAINRAMCALITHGETSTFSITKTTVDPTFENEILKILEEDGLSVLVEGSELYEN
jgi:hypothetical protein